jgi:hypothetical protein
LVWILCKAKKIYSSFVLCSIHSDCLNAKFPVIQRKMSRKKQLSYLKAPIGVSFSLSYYLWTKLVQQVFNNWTNLSWFFSDFYPNGNCFYYSEVYNRSKPKSFFREHHVLQKEREKKKHFFRRKKVFFEFHQQRKVLWLVWLEIALFDSHDDGTIEFLSNNVINIYLPFYLSFVFCLSVSLYVISVFMWLC